MTFFGLLQTSTDASASSSVACAPSLKFATPQRHSLCTFNHNYIRHISTSVWVSWGSNLVFVKEISNGSYGTIAQLYPCVHVAVLAGLHPRADGSFDLKICDFGSA